MNEYENTRRLVFGDYDDEYGGATFVPVCERCSRYVKPDKLITFCRGGLKDQPNATCSKCGRTQMVFEGFI